MIEAIVHKLAAREGKFLSNVDWSAGSKRDYDRSPNEHRENVQEDR